MVLEKFFTSLTNFILPKSSIPPIVRMQYLMGTMVTIEVTHPDSTHGLNSIYSAFEEMKRIENILSRFTTNSEISKLNHEATQKAISVSQEVVDLLSTSLSYCELFRGAFDVTLGRITEIWKLAQKENTLPIPRVIAEAIKKTGYKHIKINKAKRTVSFESQGVCIDLGGIGKGYAVDKSIEILKKKGITEATLNAGGNIYYISKNAADFGIKNPKSPDDNVMTTVSLKNESIATSANYEQELIIKDKSYGHIIDSRTGYPKEGDLLSVSVVSSSALLSDVMSTGLFILGREEGLNILKRNGYAVKLLVGNPAVNPDSQSLIVKVAARIS